MNFTSNIARTFQPALPMKGTRYRFAVPRFAEVEVTGVAKRYLGDDEVLYQVTHEGSTSSYMTTVSDFYRMVGSSILRTVGHRVFSDESAWWTRLEATRDTLLDELQNEGLGALDAEPNSKPRGAASQNQ